MSSTLNKIHVTNSTGLSLNERFTAISSQPKVVNNIGSARRSRSRSRSVQRQIPMAKHEHVASRANQRLLAQLQRKHKMQAALKLKRRSMRTVGGGGFNGSGANGRIRRGSVKAFRVGANGKPIRANSLARVATMKADNELLSQRNNTSLRRTNSSGNLANRLGPRRPTAGGAAQRIAKRRIERQRSRNSGNGRLTARGRSLGVNSRGRSRSRSRTRAQPENRRGRSRSRTRNANTPVNNRSRSRNRNRNDVANNTTARRGRSRSRSRGRVGILSKSSLPVKARLGIRPGQNNRQRNTSLTRRGVKSGRVQKRRNSTNANGARATVNDNGRRGRPRSRSAVRNTKNVNVRTRSRSRTRKSQVGQQRQQGVGQQQQSQQRNNRGAPRGRNQQRRGSNSKGVSQQRRGRSRSRTGRGSIGGSRNQGNKSTSTKPVVNKDDLDKELDQYMATTKTENEMDYLLKN